MRHILNKAGVPSKTLDLVDTCRVRRQWCRPTGDSIASSRLVTGFSIEDEGDLIFIKSGRTQHVVLHLPRYSMGHGS